MLATIATLTDQSDTDITADLTDAHRQLTRYKARFIVTLAEFHARELASAHGAPNTAVWLQRTHGIARRTAYEYLGVGTRLKKFPLLAQAFLHLSDPFAHGQHFRSHPAQVGQRALQ